MSMKILIALVCAGRLFAAYDVLLQAAIEPELQPLLAALEESQEVRIGAWTFWTGKMKGKSVVVSRTEVGPINAAAVTALGIHIFHPAAVINQGTAGASIPDLHLGDLVLGERTIDYSAFVSEHAGAGEGSDPARWKPLQHGLRIDKDVTKFPSFPGDPKLLETALKVKYTRGKVIKGSIGSAFQFNREIDRIQWLHKTYGIDSEDMESAYAAGVAAGMKTPFLAVRVISDNEWNHPKFEPAVAEACAQFVIELVRSWTGVLTVAERRREAVSPRR
jgi:adenosylhomocysteine nucleosidase